MEAFYRTLSVFVGSGLGGVARYLVGTAIAEHTTSAFPLNTFLINISGSFLLGLLMGFLLHGQAPPIWRYLLGVGVLGGYTTFSTLAWESANLLRERSYSYVLLNLLGSVFLGLLAAVVGLALSRVWTRS